MKPVLADTSYYVALLSNNDERLLSAVRWSETLLGQQVVTEYVLVELGSMFANVRGRRHFVPFVEHLLADGGTLFIPASRSLLRRGMALFASRPDKEWSLVDCISFVVMKERRLTDALTTDHHFVQAGFNALLR
jgi:uncharacterized protein